MTARQEIYSTIGLGSIWATVWQNDDSATRSTYGYHDELFASTDEPMHNPPRADESKTPEEEADKMPDDGQRVENLPDEQPEKDPFRNDEVDKAYDEDSSPTDR